MDVDGAGGKYDDSRSVLLAHSDKKASDRHVWN